MPDKQNNKSTKEKIDLKEYLALQKKEAQKRKGLNIPLPIKIILASPFIIIFCFGLFYIPFTLFIAQTSPTSLEEELKLKLDQGLITERQYKAEIRKLEDTK